MRPVLVRNLVRLYGEADAVDMIDGANWYPKARAIVIEWANFHSLSRATVACVIAALSPQNEWTRNLVQAGEVLRDEPLSIRGFPRNERIARAILRDRAETVIGPDYFKSAPKVLSFAGNLAGSDEYVTVDVHATQAALNDVNSLVVLPWQHYLSMAAAYEVAAKQVGRSNAEFQAIIWLTWKRKFPTAAKRHLRTQWSFVDQF